MGNPARQVPGKGVGRKPDALTPRHGSPGGSSRFFLVFILVVVVIGVAGLALWYYRNQPRRHGGDARDQDLAGHVATVDDVAAEDDVAAVDDVATVDDVAAVDDVATAGSSLNFVVDRPGLVSAAVYDRDGVLVRTLLRAEPMEAGKHKLAWDGLDRLGRPQPPGDYTVRILCKPPFQREFIMQVGVNPSSKPYDPWVGDFAGASSVAVDETGMYISSANAEANLMIIKQSLDGKKRMWGETDPDPWRGGLSLGTDGKTVYVLQQNGYIILFDAKTGKHTGRWDIISEGPPPKGRDAIRKRRRATYTSHGPIASFDMDIHGSTRVVCRRDKNLVLWLDEKGAWASKVKIKEPRAVAVGPGGTAYVISGTSVLSVTRQGRNKRVISGLVNPWRLTYDLTNDDLLVAEGPDDWRVKRFSATGTFKRAYGRKGGRKEGVYDPADFYQYTDITADGRGGFFIAEPRNPPRRVAHFNGDGKLVREWYGGLAFFSPNAIDPRDPTQVWYHATIRGIVLAEVDYGKKTWAVKETFNFADKADGLGRRLSVHSANKFYVRYHDGKRHIVFDTFPPSVFHHHDGKLEPVVIGNRRPVFPQPEEIARIMTGSDDKETIDQWIKKHIADYKGRMYGIKNTYLWTDKNGDRMPQAKEISLHMLGNTYHGPGAGVFVGKDFSVLCGSGDFHPVRKRHGMPNQFYTSIARLKPSSWSGDVPQYRLPAKAAAMDIAPMYVEPHSDKYSGRAGVRHTYEDNEGALYAFYQWGGGLGTFPNNQGGRYSRLTKWNVKGKRRWSVGRKAMGVPCSTRGQFSPTAPGCFHYPARIAGEMRGTIVVCDRVVNPGMAWTKDGLFAGSFFPGRVKDGLPGWVYEWQAHWDTRGKRDSIINHDSLEGGSITEHKGNVYYLSPGRNSVVVYRVHGYDVAEWTRISQNVRLSGRPASAKGKGNGLVAEFFSGRDLKGRPQVRQKNADPAALSLPSQFDKGKAYAVRLTGLLEVPLTEAYKFTVRGGAARMWLDGKLVVDYWNEVSRFDSGGSSTAIPLQAGQRLRLQIDVVHTRQIRFNRFMGRRDKGSIVRLRWASKNTDMDDVPKRFLYAEDVKITKSLTPRPATRMIEARSFDRGISSKGLYYNNFHWFHHIQDLKSGRHAGYRSIDFGSGVSVFYLHLRGEQRKGEKLELRIDKPNGRRVGTVEIPELNLERCDVGPDGHGVETVHKTKIRGVSGVHDLYLVSTAGRGVHFRAFRFE